MDTALKGSLLVAYPTLSDPNFNRTVVLVCEHNEDGAVGVVLNRPSDVPVVEHLPGWDDYLARPPVIFVGGPVQPATGVGLARLVSDEPQPGWTRVAGTVGLLDVLVPPDALVGHLAAVRFYSGYAGWGSGQLEGEIDHGDWAVVASDPGDPFGPEVERLWREVLRRQDGHLSIYADYPADPSLN